MPYGGPRFEFFTHNQHANHAAFIHKEDAARVSAIEQRRQDAEEAEFQQRKRETETVQELASRVEREVATEMESSALRQRRLANEAEVAKMQRRKHSKQLRYNTSNVIGDDTPKMGASSANAQGLPGATQFAGTARLFALSRPKLYDEPAYGALTYGACMHQRGETVEFPVGRAGQPYTPGIDRDRIVPARPDTTFKPWEGSYSTQRSMRQRKAERASEEFYLGAPARELSAEAAAVRAATIAAIAADHETSPASAASHSTPAAQASCDSGRRNSATPSCDSAASAWAPSVFSHSSSNGPIQATGTMHMVAEPRADQKQVEAHLARFGGAMTASGNKYSFTNSATSKRRVDSRGMELSPLEDFTLPELTARIVSTQIRMEH